LSDIVVGSVLARAARLQVQLIPPPPPPPRSVAAWQCVGTATALSSMPGLRPSGWLRGTFWARVPENSDVSAAHSNEQAEGSTTLAVLGRGEEEGGEC